ncbi:MAG: PQQ-binding-like beta-propeller repeat protein [Chitinivibrionales bacterium]|nr:PQQ-binding-like beta-propeller repeat protein [Chitinivibrionales bacterium]
MIPHPIMAVPHDPAPHNTDAAPIPAARVYTSDAVPLLIPPEAKPLMGRPTALIAVIVAIGGIPCLCAARNAQSDAAAVIQLSGVKGGLVVHIGANDTELTEALSADGPYLVQGLHPNADAVAAGRARLAGKGLYGSVTLAHWQGGRLPYVDHSVNLMVLSRRAIEPSDAEIERVLVPGGSVCVQRRRRWQHAKTGPRAGADEWTHYLYDPTNSAVSHDSLVDHLRHLQWIDGPHWGRHHDHMSSSSAMVTANGRSFYIHDYGPLSSILLPSDWRLVARDAYNGVVLWERPIARWHHRLFRLKSGPATLPRRLVAVGDTVYTTPETGGAVEAIDAATGSSLRQYRHTAGAEELLVADGVLYAVVNDSTQIIEGPPTWEDHFNHASPRRIVAVDAATGTPRWENEVSWVAPLTLAVAGERVLYFDGSRVVCVNAADGAESWRTDSLGDRGVIPSYYGPNLVVHRDVVLFAGADPTGDGYNEDNAQTMYGFDLATGDSLWQAPHAWSGYRSPEDLLVVQDLVWTADLWHGRHDGVYTGRDYRTGEIKVTFPPDVDTYWFHHRCYRAKATDRFLLTSRTGIELVDPSAKHWEIHHWVRGACLLGIMPANGMIYNTPHPCACYHESKLDGFNCVAPARPGWSPTAGVESGARLIKGPAYNDTSSSVADATGEWPCYRRDAQRSGSTPMPLAPRLAQAWEARLGGKLSALTAAGGKLLVAQVDAHAVHALDASSGTRVWSYYAGGRVDSPPTIRDGRVYFGCRDGFVYCLRLSDGALAWRYRVAHGLDQMVAYGQLESVWPVHGSVLLHRDELWAVAGRLMFIDGGLRLVRLDPASGAVRGERTFDNRVPPDGKDLQELTDRLNMPTASPDILVADSSYVYMRSQVLDSSGARRVLDNNNGDVDIQVGEYQHLFSPTGFLDDTYWHRTYWLYGSRWSSGFDRYYLPGRRAAAGNLLVFDDSLVYGYNRWPRYFKWTTEIERRLYAAKKRPDIHVAPPAGSAADGSAAARKTGRKPRNDPDAWVAALWADTLPVVVRAMVLADTLLFVAGPPDMYDESRGLDILQDPSARGVIGEHDAALRGEKGMRVVTFSARTGEQLAELTLEGVPVFDGMAAAHGRLYLATGDGRIVCFEGNR